MKTKAIVTFAVAAALVPAAARADCHFTRCRAMAEAFADSWNAAARSADNSDGAVFTAGVEAMARERGGPRVDATQAAPAAAAKEGPKATKEELRAAAASRPLWEHFVGTGKLLEPTGTTDAAVTREAIMGLFKTGGPLHGSEYSFNPKKIKFWPLTGEKLEIAEWRGELTLAGKTFKHTVYALFVKAGRVDEDWQFDTILMVPR